MSNGNNHSSILDVRNVPFWRRLPMILNAVAQLPCGSALELVVDLDPWPLRTHLQSMRTGAIDWEYLESGPQVWRIRLSRHD